MSPFLVVVGVAAGWLLSATLLALGLGRTVAVARARDEHRPQRLTSARGPLAHGGTSAVLHRVVLVRSR